MKMELELENVYGDYLKEVSRINEFYDIYKGEQEWDLPSNMDYAPTQKITNYVQKIINTKARFMFGVEPFFDLRSTEESDKTDDGMTQAKEDLLAKILKDNMFHKKILKARKDCSIGGRVAIKLWANEDKGVKIIFSPAQEFIVEYDTEDIDEIVKMTFIYFIESSADKKEQRLVKQTYELVEGKCIVNEGIYDGNGKLIEIVVDSEGNIMEDFDNGLDFIPVIPIQNGGLTGETQGESDVALLWPNQDAYNKLNSDDIDALKFNMFPQSVATDATEASLANLKISPGALVDLQTDPMASADGKQAKYETLEKTFAYHSKFEDTVDRLKNDMFDVLDVPNVSIDQLQGVISSGKGMKTLYWGLIAACEEDATEWMPALDQMVDYIFKLVSAYDLYESKEIAEFETTLEIVREYPIQDDINVRKRIDMEEVITEVRSREAYMDKWGNYEDNAAELQQIADEKAMMEDSFSPSFDLGDLDDADI